LLTLYPGASNVTVGEYPAEVRLLGNLPLPKSWDVAVYFGSDVTDLTYSLEAYLIV
jgi:hypothetical protein